MKAFFMICLTNYFYGRYGSGGFGVSVGKRKFGLMNIFPSNNGSVELN